jgi:hypothetical protein
MKPQLADDLACVFSPKSSVGVRSRTLRTQRLDSALWVGKVSNYSHGHTRVISQKLKRWYWPNNAGFGSKKYLFGWFSGVTAVLVSPDSDRAITC